MNKYMPDSIFDVEFSPYKYLVHWDKLNELASGKDVLPVTLELDISSKCTHKCKWCVDPPGSHEGLFMPLLTAISILGESRKLGVKGIVFKGGGESTLHPDFPRILKAASEQGFETGIVTNGSMLGSDEIIDSIVNYSSYVRVSVDGPDKESRILTHGADDIEVVINGLRKLVDGRGPERHPIIGATFCIDCSMEHLIDKCIDLGESAGIDYVLIRPPFCEEVGYSSSDSIDQIRNLISKILTAAQMHNGKTHIMAGNWVGDRESEETSILKNGAELSRRDLGIERKHYNGIEHTTGRCPASRLFLLITADGEVYGCCCLRKISGYSFGKIDYEKGITIETVLQGSQRAESISRMENAMCLKHCTHPLAKINEIIEYLKLPEKHHSSFI